MTASEQTAGAKAIADATPEVNVPVKHSDLAILGKPFASRLIHENPSGGGTYVKHAVVVQKLLMVVGPYDFELVQIIRGDVDALEPNPNGNSARARKGAPALHNVIVGALCRLTLTTDGITSHYEDVGDCEQPHNWAHDGQRMKDAMSDAIKRCAARAGVGVHLWCKPEEFILDADLLDAAVARRKEHQ